MQWRSHCSLDFPFFFFFFFFFLIITLSTSLQSSRHVGGGLRCLRIFSDLSFPILHLVILLGWIYGVLSPFSRSSIFHSIFSPPLRIFLHWIEGFRWSPISLCSLLKSSIFCNTHDETPLSICYNVEEEMAVDDLSIGFNFHGNGFLHEDYVWFLYW